MSPKDRIAELLYRLGVTRHLVAAAPHQLIVFGFHRIRADRTAGETDFDDDVFGPTLADFRQQLMFLSTHTRILSVSELIDCMHSGSSPGPASMVTFDDGYRDNYTLALPVLHELAIPATFFIPTSLIEERRLGWWDLIAYFIKKSRKSSIWLDGQEHPLGRRRHDTIECLHEVMKTRTAAETRDLLSNLSEQCQVPFPSSEAQDAELMTWEHVRDAARTGIDIGSHSHTHRVLTTLDRACVEEELRVSKEVLSARTESEIRTIAYPCGGHQHFDQFTREAAARLGYRLAFSFNTGINRWGNVAPFDVRRLGASSRPSRLAAMTLMPRMFAWPGCDTRTDD